MATLSETQLRDIAASAGTLFERLQAPPDSDGLEPSREAVAAFLSWKKVSCGPDDEAFRRRLSWDGLDEARVLRSLSAPLEFADLPRWTRWIELVLEEATPSAPEIEPLAAEAPPFVEIWIPIVRAARRTLASEHAVSSRRWRPGALASLEEQLLREIALAGAPALYREFSAYREATAEEGCYRRFVLEMLGDGLAAFFTRHPALCRLLAGLTAAWTESTAELIARLRQDRHAIAHAFADGEDAGAVVWVRPGLSDRHDGRRVVALGFESGLRLVYKPRDIGLETAFQQFLGWCDSHGLETAPPTIRLLPRDGYGWVEYVEAGVFDEADSGAYFQRAGSLLCLAWLLGGRDLHMENVVCTEHGPVLVDAETMLQPELRSPQGGAMESASCLSTGLLVLLAVDPEGRVHDTGGLRGKGGLLAPLPEREWLDLGRDTLRVEERLRRLPEASNRLVVAGREQSPERFAPEIVDGFTRTYRFLLEHRQALAGEDGPLSLFAPHRTRVLLRDSKHYAVLLHSLAEPDYAKDGLRRSLIIEALNRPHSLAREKAMLWPLVADEREAIERADVPRFTVPTTGTALVSASGDRVDRFFARSGLDAALGRLAAVGEEDLRQQRIWLRDALANPVEAVLLSTPPYGASDVLSESAVWIGRELLARGREREGALLWTYPGYPEAEGQDLGPTDLYDGAGGVGLFLAALAQETDDGSFRDAARAASIPVRQALQRVGTGDDAVTSRLGACHGLGSLLYSACWISRLLGDASLLGVAVDAVRQLPAGALRGSRGCDVMSGSAGAVLGFLTLFRHSGDAVALEAARESGRRLLDHRVITRGGAVAWPADDRRLLAGFAHGAAGIAHALTRLYAETGERAFLDAAAAAHRYERQLFSPVQGNWPIVESQAGEGEQSIHAWCHGAPGVGLARAAGLDVLGGESVLEEIRVAAAAAAHPKLSRADHLCCGNLGRADTVLTIGLRLEDEELTGRAVALATAVAERAIERRRFGLASSPHAHFVFIPGFFRGLAGIGYQLLRTASPTRLPSVLAFESDTVASQVREMSCKEQSI